MKEHRLKGDYRKVVEMIALYRKRANLHRNSSSESVIRFAHESGKDRAHASYLRDAWHDFENGRHYAGMPVVQYCIDYPAEREYDPEEVQQVERAGVESTDSSGGNHPASASACSHKVKINDGKDIVCEQCGEVLRASPSNENTRSRKSETYKPQALNTSSQPEPKKKKTPTVTDPPDEELLF